MKRFLFLIVFCSTGHGVHAELSCNGDVTAVSAYYWRGIKQSRGPALQSTAALNYSSFTVGLWCSSLDAEEEGTVETDPFVEMVFFDGPACGTLGANLYSYDLFRSFNATARYELELYTRIEAGAFQITGYLLPLQASTKNQLLRTLYWLETSLRLCKGTWGMSMLLAHGTYTSLSLDPPSREPVSLILWTAEKTILPPLKVFWHYQQGLDKRLENYFFFGLSFAF